MLTFIGTYNQKIFHLIICRFYLTLWISHMIGPLLYWLIQKLLYLAVVNLTLIDLPGLTKVAVGNWKCLFFFPLLVLRIICTIQIVLPWYILFPAEGQPDSIVEDIENMVRSYVEKVKLLYYTCTKKINKNKVLHNVNIVVSVSIYNHEHPRNHSSIFR